MKKIVSLLLGLTVSFSAFSQSLEVLYEGQPFGDTLTLTVSDVENFQTYYLDIANISNRSINVRVKRELVSLLDGASNMFCFDSYCFDSDSPMETFFIDEYDTFSYENNGTDAFHLTYFANGQFGKSVVRYTFVNSMIDIDTTSVTIIFDSEAAGVAEAAEQNCISAFPNPTTGKVIVALPQTEAGNITLSVFDVTGRFLFSTLANSDEKNKELDLTDYPSGLYFVNIKEEKQKYIIKIQKN